MNFSREDAEQAGELLHCILGGRSQQKTVLLTRYQVDLDFQDMVKALARGLKLELLGEQVQSLVAVPGSESLFLHDVRRKQTDERALYGLIHMAILCTLYPHASDLKRDPGIPRQPISVQDVQEKLHTLCKQIESTLGKQEDIISTDLEAGLIEGWKLYLSFQQVAAAGKRRSIPSMIRHVFDDLKDAGCFRLDKAKADSYQPTKKYQVQVQESGARKSAELAQKLMEGVR